MDLLLLQGRGFSFGLYLHVRVPLGACDVIRGTTNTIITRRIRGMGTRWGGEGEGCHGSFVRRGRSRGCFVSVFFASSHETTVFCLRARKEAVKRGGGEEGRTGCEREIRRR